MIEDIVYVDYSDILECSKLLLYGASVGGSKTYDLLRKLRADVEIIGFVDSYKTGCFLGKKIYSPSDLESIKDQFDSVLVCSTFAVEIKHILDGIGVTNYYFASWPVLYRTVFLQEEIDKLDSTVEFIKSNLHSEKDVELFEYLLDMRTLDSNYAEVRTNSNGLPIVMIKDVDKFKSLFYNHVQNCYFDFVDLSKVEYVIQAGVCDGREAVYLLKNYPLKRMIGYEPFGKECYTEENSIILDNSPRFQLRSKGLWRSNGWFDFSAHGEIQKDSFSSEKKSGYREVNSLVAEMKEIDLKQLDFLFCDIEDVEIPMLEGGWDSIKKNRPQLAISFYHSKEQFFEVPLKLITDLNDYIYKVGHYSMDIGDSLFYAIPREIYDQQKEKELT